MAPSPTAREKRSRPGAGLALSTALLLATLSCAAGMRPLDDDDVLAGARVQDTSYRVKERLTVPGPQGREYVLPIGEYHPRGADSAGVLYASPTGVGERAGFSKRSVPGGIWVELAPGRPFLRPALWIERGRGKIERLPLPVSVLSRYGDALVFAVGGDERHQPE